MNFKKYKKIKKENYLDRVPVHAKNLEWHISDENEVTLYVKHRGVFDVIAQKLFSKPEITKVHLDKTGSFFWTIMDGKKSVAELGQIAEAKLGKTIYPLYERLGGFLKILEANKFVEWKSR